MKRTTFIVLCIFAISCNRQVQQPNMNTPLLSKYFTENDREELVKVVAFVDSLVLFNTSATDINEAYHTYFDSVHQLYASGSNKNHSFNEPEKQTFLFGLDSTFFHKIWIKSTPRLIHTQDTVLYNPENFFSVSVNWNGGYIKYLKEKGEENEYFKKVFENIEITGDISPVIFGDFLQNHRQFDFNDAENRLWAAIFILRMTDPMDLQLKRYFENQKS
jgi:hypothetical protein